MELQARRETVSMRSILLVVAAATLAISVHQANGRQTPLAIGLLAASVVATVVALFVRTRRVSGTVLDWALFLGVLVEVGYVTEGIFRLPLSGVGQRELAVFTAMVGAAGMAAGAIIFARVAVSTSLFVILTASSAAMGLWVLTFMPVPPIDVFIFQNDSVLALVNLVNPYAISFPDPYGPGASAAYYGPGVSVDGRLMFGYPYMPLTLFLAVPGYLLGDVRYTQLAAMLGSAVLIALAGRDRLHRSLGALLLLTPQMPHVLSQSWVDPTCLLLLSGVYYCFRRKREAVPIVLGLLMASKQYMAVVVPLALLAIERPWTRERVRKFLVPFIVSGAVVTLPLVLWDVRAFIESAVTLQMRQPFRPDSLSFLAWAQPANPAQWVWLPFAMALVGLALVFWRNRREPVGFAFAFSLVLLLFFAFNKQAFANYYYLVIGGLCIAAAESGSAELQKAE